MYKLARVPERFQTETSSFRAAPDAFEPRIQRTGRATYKWGLDGRHSIDALRIAVLSWCRSMA